MRVTKLDYFIDKIVAATVENEKLRDKAFSQSKEINKLEEHIALLKERLIEHESSYLDATKAAFKRYIDAEGIRPNERFSKVVKKLEKYLELESLEKFNPEEVPDFPTDFILHNVNYFQDSHGYFMTANDGEKTFNVKITHQEYVDGVSQYIKTQE